MIFSVLWRCLELYAIYIICSRTTIYIYIYININDIHIYLNTNCVNENFQNQRYWPYLTILPCRKLGEDDLFLSLWTTPYKPTYIYTWKIHHLHLFFWGFPSFSMFYSLKTGYTIPSSGHSPWFPLNTCNIIFRHTSYPWIGGRFMSPVSLPCMEEYEMKGAKTIQGYPKIS